MCNYMHLFISMKLHTHTCMCDCIVKMEALTHLQKRICKLQQIETARLYLTNNKLGRTNEIFEVIL